MRCARWLGVLLLAWLLGACRLEDDGNPGGNAGDVYARFAGTPFEPGFGVAVAGDPAINPAGMTVFLSTGAIGCDDVHEVPAPTGYFVILFVGDRAPGEYPASTIEVAAISGSGASIARGEGEVTITAVDAQAVKGSVNFSSTSEEGVSTADGDFEVERCFP